MISFAIVEGWRSFRTLGIGGLLTLASLTVTLALGALTAQGYLTLHKWQRSTLEAFEIEAFFVPDVNDQIVSAAIAEAGKIPNAAGVRLVTREEAAARFTDQFGGDLLKTLGFNPLPPSMVLTLEGADSKKDIWKSVAAKLQSIEGVDDVAYQGEVMKQLDEIYRKATRTISILIGGALFLSLLFTGLTVAAAIRGRAEFIHILLLCGGSRLMARGPFVVLGGYYGAVAGVSGGAFAALILWLATLGWDFEAGLPLEWVPLMIAAGILIGSSAAGYVAGRMIRSV
jgi:cell division transport system permease protein